VGEPADESADAPVADAFAALGAAPIDWLHLRGAADGMEGDVDLLVEPTTLEGLDQVLPGVGFARMPSFGYATHRFFLALERDTGRWHKLDVVTELAYGPGGAYRLAGARSCLERVRRVADRPVPAADDAFWTLLLHATLDQALPDAEQLDDLARLASGATPDGVLARRVEAWAGTGTAARAIALAGNRDREGLVRFGRRLRRGAWSSDPVDVGRRRIAEWMARRLARVYVALRRPGLSVALLGPDGAGKSTLAESLLDAFPVPARRLYLGLYGAGQASLPGLGLPIRAERLVRARAVAWWHVRRGRIVLLDRHPLDLVAAPKGGPKARLRRRLFVRLAPRPDVVLILDAPGAVLFARKAEHDADALETAMAAYRLLGARTPNAVVIDATTDREAVRRAALAAIWPPLRDRWRRVHGSSEGG
jgi:thymidylate kinase